MLFRRLFCGLIVLLAISACSNKAPEVIEKKTVIHRVDKGVEKTPIIDEKEKQQYETLLAQWDKEELEKKKLNKPTPKAKSIPIVRKSVPQVVVKKPQIVKKQYIAPSHKSPVNQIQYDTLTGDYATNQEAHSFIDKMVSQHGFQRGYLNYLLSNTKTTPFLLRMAAKDAAYKKRTRNTKSRAGSWNRYRGNFLTEKTIRTGVQFWKDNRVALERAEKTYGVPQEYILGIIGVETRYGGNVGRNRAIDALAAMGFNNARRGKYFTSELEAYLLMTRREGLDPLKPMSSFAGALGLSQFMPSNIKRYAVDHDYSGSVNLWTPHDAVGSVANYFKKHGWQTGGNVAVLTSASNNNYRNLKTGFKSSYSIAHLKNSGVSTTKVSNKNGKVSLINLNTYDGDELWLGEHNFYVITRYNHSSHYAMAVHQLAQEINKRIDGNSLIRQASVDNVSPELY